MKRSSMGSRHRALGSRQSAVGSRPSSPDPLIPNPQSLIPSRSAFTLVELLVVVVIISMLAGLLLPAVMNARESAHRAQCVNNQKQLAMAVLQYEGAKQHLPGFVNQLNNTATSPATPEAVSWIPVLFPFLGRNDLWEGGSGSAGWRWHPSSAIWATGVAELICPDDARTETWPLSYVVNVGQLFPSTVVQLGITNRDGIFRNLIPGAGTGVTAPATDPMVALSDIGSPSRRPMISELAVLPSATHPRQWSSQTPTLTTAGLKVATTQDGKTVPLTDTELGFKWEIPGVLVSTDLPPIHPGVVIVAFCDGSVQQLSEDTDCGVYDNDVTKLPQ